MNLTQPIEHLGVDYFEITREEAIRKPDFPIKHRKMLIEYPKASFIILEAIGPCDEDKKYVISLVH